MLMLEETTGRVFNASCICCGTLCYEEMPVFLIFIGMDGELRSLRISLNGDVLGFAFLL